MSVRKILSELFGGNPADAPSREAEAAPSPEMLESTDTGARILVEIDHRERAGGFVEAVEAHADRLDVRVVTLPIGDAIVGGLIAIERKRTDDFVASLMDGRLFHQAAALAESFRERAIIVEGDFSAEVLCGMESNSVRGAMMSLQFDWGIHVFRARDVRESSIYVLLAAERTARRKGARGRPASHAMKVSKDELASGGGVEEMLLALPGIGPDRAANIAAAYPTFPQLMQASARDLAQIEGVGPTTAGRLYGLLHGKKVAAE